MRKLSMLLALSGSEQSYQAAQLAFSIAKRLNARITAQHVVDTRTAWALLGCEKPGGLVGSGMYAEAYDSLCTSLRTLANKLMDKFEAVARGEQVDFECLVNEGNPIHEICERAKDSDFVIVGHQPSGIRTIDNERGQFIRRSIAEGVVHECSKPTIVVQGACVPWKTFKILVSMDHLNVGYIRACTMAAYMLRMKSEIVCLATGKHEEPPRDFLHDLRKAYPDLTSVPVSVYVIGGQVDDRASLWSHKPVHVDLQASADDLIVVPTRASGGERITVFGSTPEMFIRHLTLPNMLFWPEEHLDVWADTVTQASLVIPSPA